MPVGVPNISPVEILNDKPAGSGGLIDQESTAPPAEVGVTGDIETSFVNVKELGV